MDFTGIWLLATCSCLLSTVVYICDIDSPIIQHNKVRMSTFNDDKYKSFNFKLLARACINI